MCGSAVETTVWSIADKTAAIDSALSAATNLGPRGILPGLFIHYPLDRADSGNLRLSVKRHAHSAATPPMPGRARGLRPATGNSVRERPTDPYATSGLAEPAAGRQRNLGA